ncbi:hypothetical protein SAMN06264364_10299 [Quadrisphaera granulorum]|uniref:Condensation domain-containing protein n=1 Tax=Quadrisphaera granulorum TaxID=317664 RepID=A0A316AD76_9ACTN|nr:hypothetical protein [Quadrisphaera granulorum]PWJ55736.1 hypothetical protein BXY45_10299 [Quadrisphaera granulorum]SZE95233.1 hypothetical protein SAMN06264364_10299 [Quadrisphaera granulorum]
MSTLTLFQALRTGTLRRGTGAEPGTHAASGEPGGSLLVRDSLWDGYHFVILAGPLSGLDLDLGRRRLVELCDQLRPALGVRSQGRRSVPQNATEAAALAERLVVTDPLLDDDDDDDGDDGHAGQVARLLGEPLDGLPFRISVGKRYVAIHIDHVVGDGTAMYELAPWLVSLVCGAELRPVPSLQTTPKPHIAALRNTFDRTTLPTAVRRTVAGVLAERLAQASPAPAGWDARPSVESVVDPRGTAEALKAFRQAHAKGLSSGMALMAAVWFALVEHSAVAPDLRPGIGVDLRRYLPRRTPVFGNFSACVRLPEGTPRHPVDLRDALEAEAATGVSLLAASAQWGLASVRAQLRSAVPAPLRSLTDRPRGSSGSTHHGASLVLNHLGRPTGWEKLPWESGAPRVLINAPSVDSSRAITVNIVEMSDGPHIAASFFESVVPRAAVRAALEDVTHHLDDVLAEMVRRR